MFIELSNMLSFGVHQAVKKIGADLVRSLVNEVGNYIMLLIMGNPIFQCPRIIGAFCNSASSGIIRLTNYYKLQRIDSKLSKTRLYLCLVK